MIKKIFMGFLISLGAAAALVAGGLTVSATTIDDVWQAAREEGWPESMIQDYYNLAQSEQYYGNSADWTEEQLQKAIEMIHSESSKHLTTGPQITQQIVTTTTVAPIKPGEPESPDKNEPQPSDPEKQPITLTTTDGNTFTRISKSDFIALSYDEKQAYIATFPPAQQQVIIDNLTPEERRSMLKQLPVDKKLEVANNMSDVLAEIGYNMTVEDIDNETIKLSLRNKDGELIGQSSFGKDVVENTGYDRRLIYAAAAGLFLIALAGTVFIIRRTIVKENTADERK